MYCCAILLPSGDRFRDWFLLSMKGVERHLLKHSEPSRLTFIGEELASGEFYAKMVTYCLIRETTYVWNYLSHG